MSLYLSSDEKTLDEDNTRTKFKNRILPDFFQNEPFNLKLHEIFFDLKFPTLANFEYPHIITTIIGNEHNLEDFPDSFQKNSLFKYLCRNYMNKEISPLLIEQQSLFESYLSEIDFEVFYEIHPRLNFAFSIAFIKDVSIHSQKDVLNFFNAFMFPFHKNKPLKYLKSGYIEIKSNLNIFLSNKVFQLLGFDSFESRVTEKQLDLPKKNEFEPIMDSAPTSHIDMLQILEEESSVYSNYRALEIQKPKVWVQVEFAIGSSLKHFKIEFELDLFNQRTRPISYDTELDRINRLAVAKYLSVLREHVLSLKISSTEEDRQDLNNLTEFLSKNENRKSMKGLESWGGLFTLKRANKKALIDVFHTEKNKVAYKSFHSKINNFSGALLVKELSNTIYNLSRLVSISFHPTLCYFLGVTEFTSSSITLAMQGKQNILFPFDLNYYKSTRHELIKSFDGDVPFPLQLMQLEEEITPSQSSIQKVKTDQDYMFMINRKSGSIFGDETINLKINSPQLVFIVANFVQHSLVGSYQQQILNFFPLSKNSNDFVHHVFKKPMILRTLPGSVFHINLVDENFEPIKADVGKPTLLVLKKSFGEHMFPVTLISSDANNLKLFPENRSNSFKNKLNFPLLINTKDKWGVALRSIAYPKVNNIFSEYCFLTLNKRGSREKITISLDNSYVTSKIKLIYLLNEKIQLMLSSNPDVPRFSLDNDFAKIETNAFECYLNGYMLKILGLTHSYQDQGLTFGADTSLKGVLEMNLFLLQPQEMIITSNIVEEAFYAQSRPKILKIVPISSNQSEFNFYNYIQFDNEDFIPVKLDRIDDIEIQIMSRKGDLIEFIESQDVKCQLEFKQLS